MEDSNLTPDEKVIKAKINLQKSHPFFSYVVSHAKIIRNEKLPKKTMGVNPQGEIHYHPEAVAQWDVDEIKTVLAHEVMHLCLEHVSRALSRKKLNPQLSNIADDLVVNDILMNNTESASNEGTSFKMPKGGLNPKNHEYQIQINGKKHTIKKINDKTTEDIYQELHGLLEGNEKPPNSGKGKNKGDSDSMDDHMEGDGKPDGEDGEKESKGSGHGKDWKRILVEANTFAKMQGKEPAGMGRYVDKLYDSKENWRSALYKHMTRVVPFDYTWGRPSKKSVATGIYMPAILRENIDIVIAIDTSGSINQQLLSNFLSEIVTISKSFASVRATVIVCDAEIHETYTVDNGNIEKILNLKMSGGGGTSHRPVFKWIDENKPDTRLLICFTDLWTDFPDKVPNYQVLWSVYENSDPHAPFGEILRLDGE